MYKQAYQSNPYNNQKFKQMKNEKKMLYLINGSTLRVARLLLTVLLFSYALHSNAQQPHMLVNWAKCMNNSVPFSGGAYGQVSTVDALGNFYVTGFYQGTIDFDPGVGTAPLTSVGLDVFFAKYDINGNFILAKSFGGTDAGGDYAHALAVDASGNIYVGGEFFGMADFDRGRVSPIVLPLLKPMALLPNTMLQVILYM